MIDTHIRIQNLDFSYIKNNPVLHGVNLTIARNEVVTIIGPNGGGKTTLLRLMAGLLNPDAGQILINEKKNTECMGLIGYVPQHAEYDRKFPMTLFDVIQSGLVRPFGFYTRQDRLKTLAIMEEMKLSPLENKSIDSLSGGQMQRMLIARALVSEKEILLLDEPTANIDPEAGEHLNLLIRNLSRKLTIILVTHDTGFVGNFTNRVFCINRTAKEHPVDDNYSRIIASSYGYHNQLVRHDIVVSGKKNKEID